MTTYTKETQQALAMTAACEKIIKTLDPLSLRGKRRILVFFQDLVSDPAAECTVAQLEILRKVASALGIEHL